MLLRPTEKVALIQAFHLAACAAPQALTVVARAPLPITAAGASPTAGVSARPRVLACDHGLLGRVWQASIAWDNCVTSDHHGRPALPPLDPLWRPLVLALSEAIHLEVTAVTGCNGALVSHL